jgi:hypothetical protein
MNLYESTKDLHHVCEQHPFGQLMSGKVDGKFITRQQWSDWLWSLKLLHEIVDFDLPYHMKRYDFFCNDLKYLPQPRPNTAALKYSVELCSRYKNGRSIAGAAYVLHGAHFSGGRVMLPILTANEFPCSHIVYSNSKDARSWLYTVREQESEIEIARKTFYTLLCIMSEIINGQ